MNPPSDNQEDYQQEVQLRQPSDKIKLSCDAVATYSGAFVEDGSDSQVSDIASMLITNRSSQFLQYARLVYEVDGHEAIFEIKGLSSGKSAWVLEANGLKATDSSKYVFVDGITSYLDRVIQAPEELSIQYSNNMLRVVNQSDRTLDNVVIYYKVVHTDGHYLGGITYHVNFGTLAPGDSVEKIAGHYVEDWTVIVRVGWQEAASDETS